MTEINNSWLNETELNGNYIYLKEDDYDTIPPVDIVKSVFSKDLDAVVNTKISLISNKKNFMKHTEGVSKFGKLNIKSIKADMFSDKKSDDTFDLKNYKKQKAPLYNKIINEYNKHIKSISDSSEKKKKDVSSISSNFEEGESNPKKTRTSRNKPVPINEMYEKLAKNKMLDVSDYLSGKYKVIDLLKTDKSSRKYAKGIPIASNNTEAYKKALQDLNIENIDEIVSEFVEKFKPVPKAQKKEKPKPEFEEVKLIKKGSVEEKEPTKNLFKIAKSKMNYVVPKVKIEIDVDEEQEEQEEEVDEEEVDEEEEEVKGEEDEDEEEVKDEDEDEDEDEKDEVEEIEEIEEIDEEEEDVPKKKPKNKETKHVDSPKKKKETPKSSRK